MARGPAVSTPKAPHAGPNAFDEVVKQLRAITRSTGIERTFAIGGLIVAHFFQGNPELCRDRSRRKCHSIRRLAERADCPLSKSSLHEAVSVYVALLDLPRVRTFGHISTGHVAAVVSLAVDQRERMLELAERERWGVRELRLQAVSLRRAQGERRGRQALDDHARTLLALRTATRQVSATCARLSASRELAHSSLSELTAIARELLSAGSQLIQLERFEPRASRV